MNRYNCYIRLSYGDNVVFSRRTILYMTQQESNHIAEIANMMSDSIFNQVRIDKADEKNEREDIYN